MFQSTRPRGARLIPLFDITVWNVVSIHAPAWGATVGIEADHGARQVSIHAPAWGATLIFL